MPLDKFIAVYFSKTSTLYIMGKKDKKKVKGAEKTAAKTEKKTSQKIKKAMKSKGEVSKKLQ